MDTYYVAFQFIMRDFVLKESANNQDGYISRMQLPSLL